MRYIEKIEVQLNQIEKFLDRSKSENTSVSKANVGWHIDHSLKVLNGVSGALQKSDVNAYEYKFNKWRFICLTFSFFPRGRAKAPKAVLPPEIINDADLKNQLKSVRTHIPNLNQLSKDANFKHPYFGILNKKQTLKFMSLHTEHHLKIIRDILR
ncbi:DUF1569 domain-containing protein [Winogradskyella sp. A3E31]|uniref:DUF1569 domain-containing protein n=1 Tax=Winogradskyella sp. A3E31 TaxID=3349637 RepID=UPI00398B5991